MLSVTHHALHIWKTTNMCGQFQTCVDLPTYDSNLYYMWIFPHMSGFNHTCENVPSKSYTLTPYIQEN